MPENKKIFRLGLVGCGTISRIHADAINRLENAELVSAFSRTPERREAFCKEFGIPGYSNYQQFLSSESLDLVVLCTPNGTHLDNGIPAADAGKHLVIEKPLEITTDRGKKLLDHCRKRDVRLAVIYQNRFIREVRKMKEAIDDGVIGKIIMARASVKWFRDQEYYNSAPWRGSLALDGGGALINQSIHTVDLLLWMAGPVALVYAFKGTLTHEGMEGEDNLVASLAFKNGALGVLEASTSITPAQNRILEIHGTRGSAVLNGDRFLLQTGDGDETRTEKDPDHSGASGGASSPLAGVSSRNHMEQYRAILEQIEKGEQPVVSGEDSLQSLALVEAAYRSSERGEPVSPEEMVGGGAD